LTQNIVHYQKFRKNSLIRYFKLLRKEISKVIFWRNLFKKRKITNGSKKSLKPNSYPSFTIYT
ncbi:hypothetical protein, partial [Desulfurobacterium indicum]|uniref:hypothetical protein n=1 Tax=Desulfurobacterium indicum TaxID=1914305 RepID=UPI001C1FB64B